MGIDDLTNKVQETAEKAKSRAPKPSELAERAKARAAELRNAAKGGADGTTGKAESPSQGD